MFDRLIESGGHHLRNSLPGLSMPAMWSTAAHLAIIASLVIQASEAVESSDPSSYKEAVFMLPLLPAPGAMKVDVVEGVVFQTGAAEGIKAPEKEGATVPVVGERGRSRPAAPAGVPIEASVDTSSLSLTAAYLESELDMPAERDPMSAAPAYPEVLRANNIEGHVVAQYVIDTTGYADVTSFRVMDASHPLFTSAVREALPGMHFRAAELSGKRVRQIVQQEFKFVITREMRAADSAAVADTIKP